jgi:uncharacterized protein YggT (Ycf19 family)
MTYDEERIVTRSEQTVTTPPPVYPTPVATPVPPAPAYGGYGTAVTEERIVRRESPAGMIERVVVFVFGLIQLVLVLRVILLLLNAREGNDLVSFIYNLSDPLVAPFRGILGQEAIARGGTYLDGGAIVALIGWTVLELIIIALVRVFRRDA